MKVKFILTVLLMMTTVSTALGQEKQAGSLAYSIENFLWSDLDSIHRTSLETHTIPSKVALTSLVLLGRENKWISEKSVSYQHVLKLFGFQQPTSVQGAADIKADRFKDLPMGLVEKKVTIIPGFSVTGLNVSCAACHGGRTYDAFGKPTTQAWPGLPNTSLNLEAYVQSITKGMNIYTRDLSASHKLMLEIFPDISFGERLTLKTMIYPTMKKRLAQIAAKNGQTLPFSNGSPGLTNGVSALKFTLGIGNSSDLREESGFTSIPSLGDRFLRTSLLYDGAYMPTKSIARFAAKTSFSAQDITGLSQIVALFTIPSMGQTAKGALKEGLAAEQILKPLVMQYKAPLFPREIDLNISQEGEKLYANNCAQCHGSYDTSSGRARLTKFPNRLVPQAEMKTDPKRWQAITPEVVTALNKGPLGRVVQAKQTGGYVAPILNSVWATAPYLHNGSVPTLWDLMNPAERPNKFLVGGHSLDLGKVGILLGEERNGVMMYPADVKYESVPVTYNTAEPGKSNKGHEAQFADFTDQEKQSLIEFLKRL